MLFSFGFNGELKCWNTADWSLIRELKGHTETVNGGVEYNGSLISVSRDKKINFFELDTGKCFHTVEDHKKGMDNILMTPDEKYLITSGQDKMAITRNMDGSPIAALKPNGKNLSIKTITPDSRHVLIGGMGDRLQVFSIPDLKAVTGFQAGKIAHTCVRCHPDKELAWCLDYAGNLNIIDTTHWKVTQVIPLNRKGTIGMAFAPLRNELAISADKAVLLLDADSLELKQELASTAKGNYGLNYSNDNKLLAMASADKKVRIWELD
jgi:WD40 repeat protein